MNYYSHTHSKSGLNGPSDRNNNNTTIVLEIVFSRHRKEEERAGEGDSRDGEGIRVGNSGGSATKQGIRLVTL